MVNGALKYKNKRGRTRAALIVFYYISLRRPARRFSIIRRPRRRSRRWTNSGNATIRSDRLVVPGNARSMHNRVASVSWTLIDDRAFAESIACSNRPAGPFVPRVVHIDATSRRPPPKSVHVYVHRSGKKLNNFSAERLKVFVVHFGARYSYIRVHR